MCPHVGWAQALSRDHSNTFLPDTNQIWALQNQDDNSALTTIDATTGAIAHYTYTSQTPGRGYDDVAFVGGKAYLSYTNPPGASNPGSPIIVQATLGNGTISVSSRWFVHANLVQTLLGTANCLVGRMTGKASEGPVFVSLLSANATLGHRVRD
jgi:hypothetical protein